VSMTTSEKFLIEVGDSSVIKSNLLFELTLNNVIICVEPCILLACTFFHLLVAVIMYL